MEEFEIDNGTPKDKAIELKGPALCEDFYATVEEDMRAFVSKRKSF
jgi:hypothetical protein